MFFCLYSLILLLEDMGVMLNCTVVSLKTWSFNRQPTGLLQIFVWWHYTIPFEGKEVSAYSDPSGGYGAQQQTRWSQLSPALPLLPHPAPSLLHASSFPASYTTHRTTDKPNWNMLRIPFFSWICPPLLCLPLLSPWVLLGMVLCTSKNGDNSPA